MGQWSHCDRTEWAILNANGTMAHGQANHCFPFALLSYLLIGPIPICIPNLTSFVSTLVFILPKLFTFICNQFIVYPHSGPIHQDSLPHHLNPNPTFKLFKIYGAIYMHGPMHFKVFVKLQMFVCVCVGRQGSVRWEVYMCVYMV